MINRIGLNTLKWAGHVIRREIMGQIRGCLTPGHKENEELKDINRDGGKVWLRSEELEEPGIK
jgi:hypothetical protein